MEEFARVVKKTTLSFATALSDAHDVDGHSMVSRWKADQDRAVAMLTSAAKKATAQFESALLDALDVDGPLMLSRWKRNHLAIKHTTRSHRLTVYKPTEAPTQLQGVKFKSAMRIFCVTPPTCYHVCLIVRTRIHSSSAVQNSIHCSTR